MTTLGTHLNWSLSVFMDPLKITFLGTSSNSFCPKFASIHCLFKMLCQHLFPKRFKVADTKFQITYIFVSKKPLAKILFKCITIILRVSWRMTQRNRNRVSQSLLYGFVTTQESGRQMTEYVLATNSVAEQNIQDLSQKWPTVQSLL